MKAKFINEIHNFEKPESGEDFEANLFDKLTPTQRKSMNALLHFISNYSFRFPEEVWGKTALAKHFREKWENIPEGIKSTFHGIIYFILDLDNKNRDMLFQYIIKNHVNKW